MKKAVIVTGGKQYLVSEDQVLDIDLLNTDQKTVTFEALLVIDDKDTQVGKPIVKEFKVTAQIVEPLVLADKVTAIRFKAKKRVKKVHGHRQKLTRIKIKTI